MFHRRNPLDVMRQQRFTDAVGRHRQDNMLNTRARDVGGQRTRQPRLHPLELPHADLPPPPQSSPTTASQTSE